MQVHGRGVVEKREGQGGVAVEGGIKEWKGSMVIPFSLCPYVSQLCCPQVFFKQALAIGKIVAAAGADDDVEVVRGLVDAQFGQVRVSVRLPGGWEGGAAVERGSFFKCCGGRR